MTAASTNTGAIACHAPCSKVLAFCTVYSLLELTVAIKPSAARRTCVTKQSYKATIRAHCGEHGLPSAEPFPTNATTPALQIIYKCKKSVACQIIHDIKPTIAVRIVIASTSTIIVSLSIYLAWCARKAASTNVAF